MLHLLRKARQKLLTENKFRKYIIYALGEILLVMVGILLALQFSSWNQQKENTKKEEWYLNNIVEDLEYQKAILKDMIIHYNESIFIEKSIIKDFSINYSFSDIDSLDDKLNYLTISYDFPKIDNTYRELVSSGQFSLISDKFLSVEIINYYLFCEANDNDVNNDLNNIFYKEIYPVINKYAQVTIYEKGSSPDDESLNDIDPALTLFIQNKLKEPASKLELINAVKTKFILQENFLDLVSKTLIDIDSLIKKIDAYLGYTPDMVNHY
ncbi:DUF6090 family protein [Polaribacter glomeratus]|uniref:Uncharacterized protein n=1 Tax=Polaribacter glomeratus TaxID=102 RepID=A0A2S7WW01_9FLAO|nr:DUF6090 family protein [Polaribacter glomeratus]PQJ81462.1 hypothetical protein BTO16_02210 [Polaribacter glomeratus]TXD64736.1 hypothetical protein ESX12_13040 [Polaribacter glomeratus]